MTTVKIQADKVRGDRPPHLITLLCLWGLDKEITKNAENENLRFSKKEKTEFSEHHKKAKPLPKNSEILIF